MVPGVKSAFLAPAFDLHVHDDCQVAITIIAIRNRSHFLAIMFGFIVLLFCAEPDRYSALSIFCYKVKTSSDLKALEPFRIFYRNDFILVFAICLNMAIERPFFL